MAVEKENPRGKYLVIAIIVIAVIGAVVGLLLRPSPQRAREMQEGTTRSP
jgi:hypothetical protein